jgi:hypothetical protein
VSLSEWLRAFRDLHERARRGVLSPADHVTYRAGRDDLARVLLAAQRLALRPGAIQRQTLRVARALQVDLTFPAGPIRAVTVDVSSGGFSCLLPKAPALGGEVGYALRIPAAEPLAGQARITDVKPIEGNVRVACQFVSLAGPDRDRLELCVFDTVLAQLVS